MSRPSFRSNLGHFENLDELLIGISIDARYAYLYLSCSDIEDQDAKALGVAIRGTMVTYLEFSCNNPKQVKYLAEGLEGTKVTSLNLRNNNIGAHVKDLAKALRKTIVTSLNLRWNNLGAQGAKDLAEALKGTMITLLNLEWNKIEAQGAVELAIALNGTKIISLNLCCNKIGYQDSKDLAKALNDLAQALQETNIISLNLKDNRIPDELYSDFKEQLKETNILYLDQQPFLNHQSATYPGLVKLSILFNNENFIGKQADEIKAHYLKYFHENFFRLYGVCKGLPKEDISTKDSNGNVIENALTNPELPKEIWQKICSYLSMQDFSLRLYRGLHDSNEYKIENPLGMNDDIEGEVWV